MKVAREFKEAFDLVHQAFATPVAEIEEAKAHARVNFAMAESGYLATAAMIRAGWRPREEQAQAFIERTGFVHEQEGKTA